jgi:DNA-binding CsgD family transcriptional regulator/catechol 2,3-dioxygenase-like lactoylglutathione lyase family enzyme
MSNIRKPRGRPADPDVLTPAEWRVAEAVRHGLTNRAIAERQGVSPDAVKYHVGNILGKLGLSRRAELRCWPGVARVSALSGRESGMNEELGPIGQVARTVSDIAAARVWYGEVLGLRHLYSFGDLAFFDCGGTRLFLSPGAVEGQSILYFRVTDIHGAVRELKERGAAIVNAPHMIHRHEDGTEEWMAFFNDNDGRPLGLMAAIKP